MTAQERFIHNKSADSLTSMKAWDKGSNWQFQFTGGEGIAAYITGMQGKVYDGYPTISGNLWPTPAYGGWTSYKAYYSPKWHGTFVIGYSRYFSRVSQRIINSDTTLFSEPTNLSNGNMDKRHYCGIVNAKYDPMDKMAIGLELDYGVKRLDCEGLVNDNFIRESKKRLWDMFGN